MVRMQRAVNEWSSTLDGAINDSVTSLDVADGSGLPSEGDFFLDLNGEIILVTHRSSNTLTVIRGQEGTTAVSHTTGVGLSGVICAGEFENRANERMGLKALPYGRCTKWDGTTLTTYTASDFTLFNTSSGSGVYDGNDGTIIFESRTHSGNDVSGAGITVTDATDHRFTAHIGYPAADYAGPDILHWTTRQTSGGSIRGLELWPKTKIGVRDRFNFLSTGSDVAVHGVGGRNDMWVRLEIEWNQSASNEQYRWWYSKDGVNWWNIHNHSFAGSAVVVGIGLTNVTGTMTAMRGQIFSMHHEELTF